MSSKGTTPSTTQQQQDHDCARLAREALFPTRLHRDVTHPYHFPALLVLDRYRQQLLNQQQQQVMTFSKLFPRHVVVVRNLTNENDIQWNGQPDIIVTHPQEQQPPDNSQVGGDGASFEVVPNRLTVRCTSECDKLLKSRLQKALIQRKGKNEHEIVVCSDRVLQSDYYQTHQQSAATTTTDLLPPRSLAAVEEVLAHALVVVEQQQQRQQADSNATASIQVQAAQAAECYYSSHEQVKRGSQLGFTGFSLLPTGIQTWLQRQCIQRVATEHLLVEQNNENDNDIKHDTRRRRREAQVAVQDAMKQQQPPPR